MIGRRAALSAAVLAIVFGPTPAIAQTDELRLYGDAKTAYDAADYQEAVRRFGPLVDGGPQKLTNEVLLEEAHKYYGASLVLVGRQADGETIFKTLLEMNPRAELSHALFPTNVLDLFNGVRREMEERLRRQEDAIRRAEELARREQEARIRRELLSKAVLFERTIVRRPVWQGFLPFGLAQFQNGDDAKGILFLVGETLLASATIVTYLEFYSNDFVYGSRDIAADKTFYDVLYFTNVISLVSFGLLLGLGMWDGVANLERETIVTRRLRPEEVEAAIEAGTREGR